MDKMQVAIKLASLQGQAADFQYRLLSWKVDTPEDREAVRDDIIKLDGYMTDLKEMAGIG